MKLILNNATILVTGASSGMRQELVRKIASEAKIIILVARREDQLDELASQLTVDYKDIVVYTMPCDIADISAVNALTSRMLQEIGNVDILINTAGSGQASYLENAPFAEIECILLLNIVGLTHLCRVFLPGMIKRGSGGILNFSSFFGLKILPDFSVYAGSKYYVTGFTEALRAEVAGTGVIVSCVFPGPVKTAFWDIANAEILSPPSFLFISSEQCVRETLKGFRKGRARIIPGIRIRLLLAFLAITHAPIERMVNSALSRMFRNNYRIISV